MTPAEERDTLHRAQAGDPHAFETLLTLHHAFLRRRASKWFIPGADPDDVLQEAQIGLWEAVNDYRDDMDVPFRAFLDLCATRRIISALKAATRGKHEILNQAVSFALQTGEDGATLEDRLPSDYRDDPAHTVAQADAESAFTRRLAAVVLTDFEDDVLERHIRGLTFRHIAATLGVTEKAVDNAVQRAKAKISQALREDHAA
jgi:RNA polymerase sporulation-specific sigma factor